MEESFRDFIERNIDHLVISTRLNWSEYSLFERLVDDDLLDSDFEYLRYRNPKVRNKLGIKEVVRFHLFNLYYLLDLEL
jgi:hypothetical protein